MAKAAESLWKIGEGYNSLSCAYEWNTGVLCSLKPAGVGGTVGVLAVSQAERGLNLMVAVTVDGQVRHMSETGVSG